MSSTAGPLIDVHDLERTFDVRRRVEGRRRRAREQVRGGPRPHVLRRRGRDGRLHRSERCRQVDDAEDADRHPRADRVAVRVDGLEPSRDRVDAGASHRRRLRPALDAVVGPAAARVLRAAAARSTASRRDRFRDEPRRASSTCSTSVPSSTSRSASCASARRCAATSPPRCSTTPEVLYLDEPTIGLDVVGRGSAPRVPARSLNAERGTTVMLTTHDLQDIEALCDRVIVIDLGGHGRSRRRPLGRASRAGRLDPPPSSSTWSTSPSRSGARRTRAGSRARDVGSSFPARPTPPPSWPHRRVVRPGRPVDPGA